ncbi:hypothetical protein E8E14_009601 [Neopestalotiopsis sp. 37M]|nr:hypothetical protein E8E14_009601 [Neopestalotiopsis sp. 37M]
MLFSNIASTSLAAAVLLLSPALGQEVISTSGDEDLSPRSLDVTVKWHSTNNCGDSGGPAREYSSGACIALSDSSRGVEIRDRHGSCHLKSFSGGACDGTGRTLNNNGCWTLSGKHSVKVIC